MLKKCPECQLQVSDKAITCPHCGYPLQEDKAKRAYRKPNKHRRLPNGFGQISEIKNSNLRKPFRAMITVGKDMNGRPISQTLKPVAYFETYNEAYAALVEYHKNPYDIKSDITMSELFDQWIEQVEKRQNKTYVRKMKNHWRYLTPLHRCEVTSIRVRHIKQSIDEAFIIRDGEKIQASPDVRNKTKTLLNLLMDYAVEQGLVEHNYARDCQQRSLESGDYEAKPHIAFTDEELELIWKHKDHFPNADTLLINCYTGWRPQELCDLTLQNTDIEHWTLVGGLKTDNGRNRIVPIHSKIQGLLLAKYQYAKSINSEYLFNFTDSIKHHHRLRYHRYYDDFCSIRDALNLNPDHRPHDARKTFVTLAKKYHVDEYAIKRLVGHSIRDLTEAVYTERDPEWLREELEKIGDERFLHVRTCL